MHSTTKISVDDFNRAAKIIEDASVILAQLGDLACATDETRALNRIDGALLDLGIALRRRLDLKAA